MKEHLLTFNNVMEIISLSILAIGNMKQEREMLMGEYLREKQEFVESDA